MIAFLLFALAAVAGAVAALVAARAGLAPRRDRSATVAALAASALWAGSAAALGPLHPAVLTLEVARNLAWIAALFRHFANDGRDESLRVVRPLIATLVLVEGLQLLLLALPGAPAGLETSALLRMLIAVGALLLVHNLYGGASDSSRRLLGWNSAAMALFWLFELNVFTIVALTGELPAGLEASRAAVLALASVGFAIGAAQGKAGLAFRPSRAVTFSTLSLAVLAVYFLVMVGLASGAAKLAGDLARVTQVGFLLLAATAALIWLPSPRLRGTARVLALKHLFKHRYDYREEWLRFTRTIGSGAGGGAALPERAVQSLAQIADSGAGVLLTPGDDGELTLAARWRWPGLEVPARAAPLGLVKVLETQGCILDLDALRAGIDRFGEAALVPDWLIAEPAAWAAVPLLHGERLVGLVVLARPAIQRRLDWEDFDLLGIAGRHVASALAEQAGHSALEDAARFEEFHRRMAFVMHDIKNLSSQFGLLARNAEKHADNPAFRKDMLVTLRSSAEKLDGLVARLGRYGPRQAEVRVALDLHALAQRIAQRLRALRRVDVIGAPGCVVLGDEELLDQALSHLIQNAIEASAPEAPITIEIANTALRGEIAVVDAGAGMSAEFIRTALFRPFVSTKPGGFGIGVCEARDHARAMGGRLDVESREGLGSRFTISLPLAEASRLISARGRAPACPATEEAA
ncbi:XrtA/PEP-CTERM system histidine kinase PrsK [Qipengyuania sediminis]|uniref:XrtA/PEP-CTERM system histidine kinase PrsK n=1 Tax=Qipengyuania sediminis TaxID=1532023 RepID=UPI00105A01BC|nr:XrtA/PEP-CTERM system histidine kinase PrsK [Qipengyuania sediminis]